MTPAPTVHVLVVARDADRASVLPAAADIPALVFDTPAEALAQLRELRAKGEPAVFVVGRSDINRSALLMELTTRHPDVPVVIAAGEAESPGISAGYAVTRPARSQALIDTIADASRTAAQRARVRTTLDRLNVRIGQHATTQDPRYERRLLLSRLYFQNILEQAHDGVFVTDRMGVVALWNPAAERMFGIRADAIMGRPIDEAAGELLPMIRALSPGRRAHAAELSIASSSGTRQLELSLSLVLDEEGNGVAVSGIVRDVTERRALQQELERRARELAESNRHKDEFLAILSHELRTPLNVVLGWAHMLERSQDPASIGRGLEMIRRNAELQQRLVEDLLDYARIVAGRLTITRQQVEVTDVVCRIVESLKPAIAERKLTLLEAYESRRHACVDSDRLRQVIVNLVSNAMKFTPAGGTVAVRVSDRDGWIDIAVSDTGEGIAPEFLPRVFDEFKQADSSLTRRQQGLGLGLAIARRIIELHEGRITAHSEGKDRGTTITVSLPVMPTA